MSVLIYIEKNEEKFKKSNLETISYGVEVARKLGVDACAIIGGTFNNDLIELEKYGLQKVYQLDSNNKLFDTQIITAIKTVVEKEKATVIILGQNNTSKNIAGELAAKLKAGIVTAVIAMPDLSDGFVVKKAIYSGKAIVGIKINTPIKIITVNPNVLEVKESSFTTPLHIEKLHVERTDENTKLIEHHGLQEKTPLTEAEIVVSGGMGLKGPENWHLITDLADALGAASACSRPVSDNGWRPHYEHVGQTGIQIAPNLYIAVGISGAIQHLGGVNQSKYIAAINKDAEAPIFKAADFGMVGDLFEILPKLTEEIKKAR